MGRLSRDKDGGSVVKACIEQLLRCRDRREAAAAAVRAILTRRSRYTPLWTVKLTGGTVCSPPEMLRIENSREIKRGGERARHIAKRTRLRALRARVLQKSAMRRFVRFTMGLKIELKFRRPKCGKGHTWLTTLRRYRKHRPRE